MESHRDAEAILALPPPAQRLRLKAILNRATREDAGTPAQLAALDYNAHLCTELRERAEARGGRHPWNV